MAGRVSNMGVLCLGLLMAACATPPSSQQLVCVASVASNSNPEAGARGDFNPNVLFADLTISQYSVGYGAAGGRSDEITIADGVLHLARPDGMGGHRERQTFYPGEGAYMVQLVPVAAWGAPTSLEGVSSLDELGASIASAARSAGCSGSTKLAYRIEAHVESAEWSLDTLPRRGDFTTTGEEAVIVGLFANVDQAQHFVPVGRNIHAHIVFPRLGVAGHLKSVRVAPGAKLSLQAS